MKIFLDNCINHIALKRMLPLWQKWGVKYSTTPKGCDVQLSFIKISTKTELPLVVRIDGIYYDSATNYKKRNERISEAHSKADAVIYQSHFCRGMVERYLTPRKGSSLAKVIYNGIEKNWCGQRKQNTGFNILTVSSWRRHKRLKEIIELFQAFRIMNGPSSLMVVGDLIENKKQNLNDIYFYGTLDIDSDEMKYLYRQADVFLHLSKKDCSPNVVIEAIGAGIPVITTTACGGASEMCYMTTGCMSAIESQMPDPCKHYSDKYNILPHTTKQEMLELLKTVYNTRHRVNQPEELSIGFMARRYMEILRAVV